MAQAGINPLLFGDPTAQASLDQLQRQQQWAQTLLEQSQQSPQGQMVGDRYVRPSITQGLAQLLKAYMGRQGVDDASTKMANIQAQAYGNILNQMKTTPQTVTAPAGPGDLGSGTYGIDQPTNPGGVRPSATYQQTSPLNPVGLPEQIGASWLATDPKSFFETQAKAYTDPTILKLRQAGVPWPKIQEMIAQQQLKESSDPTVFGQQQAGFSPQQIYGAAFGKAAKDAEIDRKNGNAFANPFLGVSGIVPKIPDNAQASRGVDQFGNPIGGVTAIPGAQQIVGANTRATEANKILTNVQGPDNRVYTGYGSQFAGGGVPATNAPPATPPLGAPGASPAGAPQQPVRSTGGFASEGPGFSEIQQELAKGSGKRMNDIATQASESPMRVNVIDNILDLSRAGVKTGPTSDFSNKVKGIAADTFGIKSWEGKTADYQELTKFIRQNAVRAWQGAGGTGTDAQLDASINANINSGQFPKALQAVAEWSKAGEMALQAKYQAQTQAGIKTAADEARFNSAWVKNMDPTIYLLRAMSPQDAQQYVSNMQKTPAGKAKYQALMEKAQNLKQLGGL